MLIRAATAQDAAACAEIYRPHVVDGWVSFELVPPNAVEMASRIESFGESHGWLIAEQDAAVIGYAYASPHRTREAYQTSVDVAVYVANVAQGQGVARRLYEALFAGLQQRGFHAAFAGIAIPNASSEAMHQALGFVSVGIYREVGWKRGGWRDVGWWQKIL